MNATKNFQRCMTFEYFRSAGTKKQRNSTNKETKEAREQVINNTNLKN